MSSFKIIVLPVAENDMKSIGDYIAETFCNSSAALKLINKFYEQICRIAEFPFSGNVLKNKMQFDYEYRYKIVENYLIFYTVDETKQSVNIARVLYGASNYNSILNES